MTSTVAQHPSCPECGAERPPLFAGTRCPKCFEREAAQVQAELDEARREGRCAYKGCRMRRVSGCFCDMHARRDRAGGATMVFRDMNFTGTHNDIASAMRAWTNAFTDLSGDMYRRLAQKSADDMARILGVAPKPEPTHVILSGERIDLTQAVSLMPGSWTIRGHMSEEGARRIAAVAHKPRPAALTLAIPETKQIHSVLARMVEATWGSPVTVCIEAIAAAAPPKSSLGISTPHREPPPKPDPRVEREQRRRAISAILAEDARRFPAFATARKAAVMAHIEPGPNVDTAPPVAFVEAWLAEIHEYEAERGGMRAPSIAVAHLLRDKSAGAELLRAYERARSL